MRPEPQDVRPRASLRLVEENGLKAIEGMPGAPLMASARDADLVLEACFSSEVRAAILFPENLTRDFFDLSSRDAGEVLQRLRNYGVRLAVVCPPASVRFSRRFGEMLAEERRGRWFGVFDSRQAAWAWIGAADTA